MFELFKNPSNEYRPIPFWSWNDELKEDKLRGQITEMSKQGIGGYFMHARGGLKNEYLGEKWFDCVEACIEHGKEIGMDSWLYDEEGWPSGFAGGKVTAKGEDYQAKTIRCKKYNNTMDIIEEKIVGIYLIRENKSYVKINKDSNYICQDKEELVVVYLIINPYYIDVASKKAVDCFIEETHERYYKIFGKDFGSYMKGFFTDEPRFVTNGTGDMPWSYELEDYFIKNYGYKIIDFLPSLFLEFSDSMKVRYDFWEAMNGLFVTNFMKNIYDWCEEHNCQVTGHIMMEESLYSQMSSTGGVMPFYEYFHIPGIDWLRRMISDPNTPKQVGSVASQLGKKHVLTESFALCGWDVTFEELKWIAEWQFVNGVNLLCQHLQGYTIQGLRKRDYPPSLFIQQTWWDKYYEFNDYISRLGVVLSQGKEETSVLLIHPIRSSWAVYDGTRNSNMKALDESLSSISNEISALHIGYHYGDETIISKYGEIIGNKFVVGKNSYTTVVLPLSYSLDKKTIELLLEFINNGGKVISLDKKPIYTNGNIEDLERLNKKIVEVKVSDLPNSIANKTVIISEKAVIYQKRIYEEYDIVFMVNHGLESFNTNVSFLGDYKSVSIMNGENGEITPISFISNNEYIHIDLSFCPMQSYIILLDKVKVRKCDIIEKQLEVISLGHNWEIEQMDLNSYTLDYCRYKIDDEDNWSEKIHTIRLMDILLQIKRKCKVQMKFEFEVEKLKCKEFYVVIEQGDSYEVLLNSNKIIYKNVGYWKDETFIKIDIKDFVNVGKNELIITKEFFQSPKVYEVLFGENVYETELNKLHYDTELESIYLLGDFSVYSKSDYTERGRNAIVTNGDFIISSKPTKFDNNNFTIDGLAFFAGTVTVSQNIIVNDVNKKQVILKLNKPYANLVEIYVNDKFVKDIIWAPYETDITDFIEEGTNHISLKLYSSNRNLFGPHHHTKGETYNVGPQSYTGKWSWVERDSEANVNEGADKRTNYWSDTYCFVKFGFSSDKE